MIKLKDIVNIELFENDLNRGMIRESIYSKDPKYSVFCYTKEAQVEGYWNIETTYVARGLVVKKINDNLADSIVIARGMNKFFTVEQSDSDWGKLKFIDDDENVTVQDNVSIDLEAPVYVSDKVDGALGIAVPMNDDYLLITKGSFESDEAIAGNKILHEKYDSKEFYKYIQQNYPGYTPLFEIISNVVEHVIEYDFDDIIFLGLVDNKTGKWYPNLPVNVNFKRPEYYGVMTLEEAFKQKEIDNHEGLVLTIMDNTRQMYKIKYPTFLEIQKIKCSLKSIKDIVKKDMTPMQIFKEDKLPIPQPFSDRYYNYALNNYYLPIKEKAEEATKLFNLIAYKYNLFSQEGQKQFALDVQALNVDSGTKKIIFSLKDIVIKQSIDTARKLY